MPANLAALTSLAGGVLNAQNQNAQNQESARFSKALYEKQKQDNLEFWRMQNEYNSPQSQMKRFQEAGLNPHLIYGQGNSGPASPVQTPDVQTPTFRSPEMGNALISASEKLTATYNAEIMAAQLDNLKAQNTVILEEALLKKAQTLATVTGEEKNRFTLEFEKGLAATSADARREILRQLKTSTDLSINRDSREAALNAQTVKEAAERVLLLREQQANTSVERDRIRATIKNLKSDTTLKQLDIDLKKLGIQPHDPMWSRIVGRAVDGLADGSLTAGSLRSWLFRTFGK